MRRLNLIIAVSVGVAVLLPCCAPKIVPEREKPKPVYLSAEPEELLTALRERNAGLKGMQANGSLEYRFTYATKGYRGAGIRLQFRKPDKVYIRGRKGVVGTIFRLVTDGDKFFAENTRGKEVYVGSVQNSVSWDDETEIWEGLHPSVLAEALLLDDLKNDMFVCETFPGHYIIATYGQGPEGKLVTRRRIWIEREHLRVKRHQIFNENAEMTTEAVFSRYKEVDGVEIPNLIFIDRPWEELRMKLELKGVRLNPPINDELFIYEIPEGFEVKKLGEDKQKNAEPG